MRILILGGIREASTLATKLVQEGHDVTTSLAGRTKEPKPLKGKVRTGGFGGIRSQRYAMIVDNGVVTKLNVEEPQKFEVSNAETILAAL